MNIAIIGGGAAGFFAAIAAKSNYPDANVTILERSSQLLAKVRISGGGRCNVTTGTEKTKDLCAAYPRGGKSLKKAFGVFDNHDTMHWFEERGVELVTQDDGCVFPASQDSQTIIDCLMDEVAKLRAWFKIKNGLLFIERNGNDTLTVTFSDISMKPQVFDKIIVATGGSPRVQNLDWLKKLGHKIEKPVPSLFTFNMPNEPITELMGIVAENAIVSLQGTKLKSQGPLLITHWGMSGPAILKLSSFGARILSQSGYDFTAQVNWVGIQNHENVSQQLVEFANSNGNKKLSKVVAFGLPTRLWHFLLQKYNFPIDKVWGELGNKGIHTLTRALTNDPYKANGKTSHKEEFVTCGGVSLDSIDMRTMQSRVCPNLYFAGEVMDIDGVTGGYNFQAAWTTAYIAGQLRD